MQESACLYGGLHRTYFIYAISVLKLLVTPTCRRNDAIHAQIFNHLAIFICGMNHCGGGHEQTRCCAAEPGDIFEGVLCE